MNSLEKFPIKLTASNVQFKSGRYKAFSVHFYNDPECFRPLEQIKFKISQLN